MLGVKVEEPCRIFCDNASVVTHVTEPSATLNKKNLSICYHLVREAVAAGIVEIYHIDGPDNPANPLTKSETQHNLKLIEEMFFMLEIMRSKIGVKGKLSFSIYLFSTYMEETKFFMGLFLVNYMWNLE